MAGKTRPAWCVREILRLKYAELVERQVVGALGDQNRLAGVDGPDAFLALHHRSPDKEKAPGD